MIFIVSSDFVSMSLCFYVSVSLSLCLSVSPLYHSQTLSNLKNVRPSLSLPPPRIDAHGLKIQGGGVLKFLPKSLGGGSQGFQEKLPGGVVHLYLRFIAFLLTSFSKICLGGGGMLFHIPPPPLPPRVHLCPPGSVVD